MGTINFDYEISRLEGKYKHLSLNVGDFRRFNTDVLGLGKISKEGEHIDSLAAIFDLEGFTSFCNQMDPHLIVPEYLDRMLAWLFERISQNFTKEVRGDDIIMWGKFPFFAKFMGDGILFLWNTTGLGQASMGNIIINLYKACKTYSTEFFPAISKDYAKTPAKMRCGISRGQVIAIGGGKDFVGPCINVASRLQKVSQLSFAFSRKGFNYEECFGKVWRSQFVMKRIAVRGIGENELVFISAEEFEGLPPEEKKIFQDP